MSAEKIKDTISFLEGYAAGVSVLPNSEGAAKCVSLAAGCLRDALAHIRQAELIAARQRSAASGIIGFSQENENQINATAAQNFLGQQKISEKFRSED
jgi:hypothetical protein